MIREGDYVAIFNSVHRIMEAEKLVKSRRLEMKVIPAPRALAADCGLAMRYTEAVRPELEAVLAQAGLMPGEVYRKIGDEFQKVEDRR